MIELICAEQGKESMAPVLCLLIFVVFFVFLVEKVKTCKIEKKRVIVLECWARSGISVFFFFIVFHRVFFIFYFLVKKES